MILKIEVDCSSDKVLVVEVFKGNILQHGIKGIEWNAIGGNAKIFLLPSHGKYFQESLDFPIKLTSGNPYLLTFEKNEIRNIGSYMDIKYDVLCGNKIMEGKYSYKPPDSHKGPRIIVREPGGGTNVFGFITSGVLFYPYVEKSASAFRFEIRPLDPHMLSHQGVVVIDDRTGHELAPGDYHVKATIDGVESDHDMTISSEAVWVSPPLEDLGSGQEETSQ